MNHHKQTTFTFRGRTFTVDAGIRSLIRRLNGFPGVETCFSCQGDPGDKNAYVLFRGPGAVALLAPLATAIFTEEAAWRKRHRHVCRGCLAMTITLEVCGHGIVLRWDARDYARLMRLTATVSKALKTGAGVREPKQIQVLQQP